MAGTINYYRKNANDYRKQRDENSLKLDIANEMITDIQTRQRDVAELDARYLKELANAKAKLDDFELCVRDGKCGLLINAKCPKISTSTSPSMDDATRPRLTDSAQRDYFILRKRIDDATIKINGLQDYIKNQCLK